MSFYGNPKRINSSPFIFDKIYPNRLEMENQKTSDNVYIGRYVLVKYTTKYDNGTLIEFNKYIDNTPEDTEDTSKAINADYQNNADIDIAEYNDTYDATVWQKIYTGANQEGEPQEKYILIAELNAAVPRLELNPIAPKYYVEQRNNEWMEDWNSASISEEASSEDAYTVNMPDVLKLDVNTSENDFFAKGLTDQQIRRQRRVEENQSGETETERYYISAPTAEPIEHFSHEDMFSAENNSMKWDNTDENGEIIENPEVNQDIYGKQLNMKMFAFGQAVSDIYDILYGIPSREVGQRPYFSNEDSNNPGLLKILESIGSEDKGNGAEDAYERAMQVGQYYYFSTRWNDVNENPNNFIENIPEIIGVSTQPAEAHYYIDFNDSNSNYIKSMASITNNP